MLPDCRRVVTVNGADGRSRILFDEPTPHRLDTGDGRGLIDFWRHRPATPQDLAEEAGDCSVVLHPPAGGSVFRFFRLAPASTGEGLSDGERRAAARKVFETMEGLDSLVDTSRHPAMHKTRSIDYIVLLQGEVTLLLDEGETDLKPFDVVVQRGTNHAWINRSPEPALLVAVLTAVED